MAKGMPSMVALLGLLAVAGYQNRDKLGGLLDGLDGKTGNQPGNRQNGGLGEILGNPGGMLGGASACSVLSGGLGDLIDQFRQSGRSQQAESWITDGVDNVPVAAGDLEETLGEDTLSELTAKTGLSRAELLERLSTTLPLAVNRMTPMGRLPTETEAGQLL